MNQDDIRQFELLATLDRIRTRVENWANEPLAWEPGLRCQALMKHLLERVATLQIRYEAPLVVATFGGTGTGKSALVNALVGEEVSSSGRQRPTTRKPKLIVHSEIDLSVLSLPLDQVEIVQRDNPVLRDIMILDCPDPDTNEGQESGTNLDRLRKLLPFCDVLLVVSTQQKYRSARVADELLAAAAGCRMLFVQSHADLDEDIRDDWRNVLASQFDVPEIYFVDSLQALQERKQGNWPAGEFGQLLDLLTTQLGASERVRVRRVNVVDLLRSGFERCLEILSSERSKLHNLSRALDEQRDRFSARMAEHLKQELLTSHGLWERRLLASVTEHWGLSPFSACLKLYQGMGSLLASLTFFRARNTAQMAILGTVQGKRWLNQMRSEQRADEVLERVSQFGLDESSLREAELIVHGHAADAGFETSLTKSQSMEELRKEASAVGSQFVIDAGERIDDSIEKLAARNSRISIRWWYEFLFAAYLLFVLYRVGRNFFYESFWLNVPLLDGNFYLAAGLFLLLWSGVLVIAFTRRLRRGVRGEVQDLIAKLVEQKLAHGLYPDLERAISRTDRWIDDAEHLTMELNRVRNEIAVTSQLGGRSNDFVATSEA